MAHDSYRTDVLVTALHASTNVYHMDTHCLWGGVYLPANFIRPTADGAAAPQPESPEDTTLPMLPTLPAHPRAMTPIPPILRRSRFVQLQPTSTNLGARSGLLAARTTRELLSP